MIKRIKESKSWYYFQFLFDNIESLEQFSNTYESVLKDVRWNNKLLTGRIPTGYVTECIHDLVEIYNAQKIELK